MANRIVICQNDYPVEVCADGATTLAADVRCRQLKEAKLAELRRQGLHTQMVYFHWQEVPVWEPVVAEKPMDATDPKEVDKFISKLEGLIDARIELKAPHALQRPRYTRDAVAKARKAFRDLLMRGIK